MIFGIVLLIGLLVIMFASIADDLQDEIDELREEIESVHALLRAHEIGSHGHTTDVFNSTTVQGSIMMTPDVKPTNYESWSDT